MSLDVDNEIYKTEMKTADFSDIISRRSLSLSIGQFEHAELK